LTIARWDSSYQTGHPLVDSQHENLFKMVNELHEAIVAEKGKEVIAPTLEKLAKYTVEHFKDEEKLMTEIAYPALAAHRRKHEDLTTEVKDLVQKYKTGQTMLSITLSNFLAKWLRHHIKEDDMALIKYMKTNSSKATANATV
jgi:hemerythrin-like metal-binding protein